MFVIVYEREDIKNMIKIPAIFRYPYKIVKCICVKYFIYDCGVDKQESTKWLEIS